MKEKYIYLSVWFYDGSFRKEVLELPFDFGDALYYLFRETFAQEIIKKEIKKRTAYKNREIHLIQIERVQGVKLKVKHL